MLSAQLSSSLLHVFEKVYAKYPKQEPRSRISFTTVRIELRDCEPLKLKEVIQRFMEVEVNDDNVTTRIVFIMGASDFKKAVLTC